MKKFILVLFIFSFSFMYSCTQDDGDVDISSMVVGNYLGVLTINDTPISSVSILVERLNDNTIEVSSANGDVTPFRCKLLLTGDYVTADISGNSDVTIFVELLRNPPRFSYEYLEKEEEFVGNLIVL